MHPRGKGPDEWHDFVGLPSSCLVTSGPSCSKDVLYRYQLDKSLSTGFKLDGAIGVANTYPVDSAIQRLNNQGLYINGSPDSKIGK